MKVSAIITAAGLGSRFGEKKQFKLLGGAPLYTYSLKLFLLNDLISEIILVVPRNKKDLIQQELSSVKSKKNILVVAGAEVRQNSVKNGILASDKNAEIICIHDAARPFLSKKIIDNSINSCMKNDGSIVAIPNYDTLKSCRDGFVYKTVNRESIWLAQTPQVFWKRKILQAFKYAEKNNLVYTDESSLMESFGFKIAIVGGDINNFKITSPLDWHRAESVIK